MTETIATFSPLYQQIKALILGSLQAGEWKPGEAIPSENDLATRFKVSQGTVRKAIDELASENLLVRRQGKGTFVATHHEDRVHFRFLRLVPDDGEPHYPKSTILDCKRLRAPAEIARLLDLKPGDAVVQIERILYFSEEATVYEEIWLPGTTFKGLSVERLVDFGGCDFGVGARDDVATPAVDVGRRRRPHVAHVGLAVAHVQVAAAGRAVRPVFRPAG